MNLITDKWIPVILKGSSRKIISPDEIVDPNILEIDFTREDLNLSALSFFISLIQTSLSPQNERGWEKLKTMTSDVLKSKLMKYKDKFDLFGKKIRFMQDMGLGSRLKTALQIQSLFQNFPGEKTIKEGRAFFIKEIAEKGICPACAAMALYYSNTNGGMIGGGHYSSIRGGASRPLNTLIMGKNLWETVLFNVVPTSIKNNDKLLFPWEENKQRELKDTDVHPYFFLWEMPLREYLKDPEIEGECDICGRQGPLVTNYIRESHGYKYNGCFDLKKKEYYYSGTEHPFSPFNTKIKKYVGASHDRNSLSSRVRFQIGSKEIIPAKVVSHYLTNRTGAIELLLTGYSADQAKVLLWVSEKIPLLNLDKKDQILKYIESSDLFYNKIIGKYTQFSYVIKNFWSKALFPYLQSDTNTWVEILYKTAEKILDHEVLRFKRGYVNEEIDNIKKEIQKILGQKPKNVAKVKVQRKIKEKRLSPEKAKTFLSWWGKLNRNPSKLREMKNCMKPSDVESTKTYKDLYSSMEKYSLPNPKTLFNIIFVLSRIKKHEKTSFIKNLYNLTENRRNRLIQAENPCKELVSVIDLCQQKANVLDVTQAIINWETTKISWSEKFTSKSK